MVRLAVFPFTNKVDIGLLWFLLSKFLEGANRRTSLNWLTAIQDYRLPFEISQLSMPFMQASNYRTNSDIDEHVGLRRETQIHSKSSAASCGNYITASHSCFQRWWFVFLPDDRQQDIAHFLICNQCILIWVSIILVSYLFSHKRIA